MEGGQTVIPGFRSWNFKRRACFEIISELSGATSMVLTHFDTNLMGNSFCGRDNKCICGSAERRGGERTLRGFETLTIQLNELCHDCFLGVEAVFGFVEDDALRTIEDFL